jgi:hypothetical protein
MVTLTTWPWWVLLPLSLVVVLGITFGAKRLLTHFFGADSGSAVTTAGPLMTGFGALFAFLSAFVIATEWSTQTTADAAVAREAAASARLAWASTAAGVGTDAVQAQLDEYLTRTIDVEWGEMADGQPVSATESEPWRRLEQTTRVEAAAPGVTAPSTSEMLAALDDLASARRERLDISSRALPIPLFMILGLSGLALCVNAAVLTIPHSPRTTVVAATIIVVVALDLGLVLVLGGPFRGTLTASPDLLQGVQDGLRAGFFRL